jgi:Na+/proline symporter
MPKFFNMFLGPLGALFMIGMFFPRCTSRSAIPAVLVGLTVAIFWSWWREIMGTSVGPSFLLAVAVPCLTTLLLAYALSWLVERPRNEAGDTLNWQKVVHGPDSK